MEKVRPTARLLAVLGLALASSGCLFWAPTLDPMRHEVARALPGVEVRPEVQVHLGRLSMAIARSIIRAGGEYEEDDEARQTAELMSHLSGVEVAVYEIEGLRPGLEQEWSEAVSRLADRRGWRVAARFQDGSETGSVLYRQRGKSIESVYVFALSEESLVLARFRGQLDQALADAIALKGSGLPKSIVKEEAAGGES